jgi:hypothetical protein
VQAVVGRVLFYSPKCLEDKFSEVHGSKLLLYAALTLDNRPWCCPPAPKCGDLVAVVTPMCIKGLRLVTMQLPEKFSPIGLGTNRSSHIRLSRKFLPRADRKGRYFPILPAVPSSPLEGAYPPFHSTLSRTFCALGRNSSNVRVGAETWMITVSPSLTSTMTNRYLNPS